jgi:TfoX/Sxy family transcriptional regulator of competence genes
MAFDPELADRARGSLAGLTAFDERAMFGGLAFMVGGHMACGVLGDDLILRLGPDRALEALERPGVRPMDFTGRPLKGYVYVSPPAVGDDDALRDWLGGALAFVATLPPKQ